MTLAKRLAPSARNRAICEVQRELCQMYRGETTESVQYVRQFTALLQCEPDKADYSAIARRFIASVKGR